MNPAVAKDLADRHAKNLGKLAAAKAEEKEARRLRREGRDEEAIEAYDRAKDLYQSSDFAYQRDSELRQEVQGAINRCNTIAENIRRPKTQRPPPTTPRPKCLHCDKPLRRYKYDGKTFADGTPVEWGDYGDGRFCGLRCGWGWACGHSSRAMTKRGKKP
jgi:hypothetical protein